MNNDMISMSQAKEYIFSTFFLTKVMKWVVMFMWLQDVRCGRIEREIILWEDLYLLSSVTLSRVAALVNMVNLGSRGNNN